VKEGELITDLVEAVAGVGNRDLRATRVAAAICRFGGYRWVGIYDVGADEIAVLGWDGPAPPAHPSFPRTEGLGGAAAAAGQAVFVGDVRADPRYLTTHTTTLSEIVVPVFDGDLVVGLIDVESERRHAFSERDADLLQHCAALIAPLFEPRGSGS
jgi:L-methionine (R)-S-oxide reductase